MRKYILSVFCILLSLSAQAQKLQAESSVVDMGQVQFYSPTTGVFELKNTSSRPLTITKVDTGCGCAVAEYPKGSIASGQIFSVSVTYDARMMGHFHKMIEVYGSDSPSPVILQLRGVVVDEVEEYIGDFPFQLGELKSDCNTIVFDDLHLGEQFKQRFHIYNPASVAVRPQIMHLPDYLKADVSPSTVAPNRSAEVTISLDSRLIRDFGLEQTSIFLGANPGEKVSADKKIDVSIVLLPPLEELTAAEKLYAPKMEISTKNISLPISDGKKKNAVIELRNVGRSQLNIQNMQLLTGAVKVELNKKVLNAGETAKLKVTVDPKKQIITSKRARIIMITDDPDNQKVLIDVNLN